MGIICGTVLYPQHACICFCEALLPLLINTLNLLKEEYRIYLASLQQADIQTWNPYTEILLGKVS